ncbi:MAG: DUF3391 domain-containing protein [Rheinheimera sp.]|nr:DUF3391 domain-containing protein [Rheinheimera sp.]
MKHPFLSNKFKVESYEQIAIIQTLDLEFVYFFPEKKFNRWQSRPRARDCRSQSTRC